MILSCSCIHEYQDKVYGLHNRVHNACIKGHRCTVCGNIKGSVNQQKKEKEDERIQ